jgi:hypothetical protein
MHQAMQLQTFFFCGPTAKIWPRPTCFQLSNSNTSGTTLPNERSARRKGPFTMFFYGSIALVGLDLLIIEVSRSHSHTHTPKSAGRLWIREWPLAETSTWQHISLTGDSHPWFRLESNPSIPASEQPKSHTSDRATTRIGDLQMYTKPVKIFRNFSRGLIVTKLVKIFLF